MHSCTQKELCTKAKWYTPVISALVVEEFPEVAAWVTQQAQSQPELYMTLKAETSQL